MATNSKRPISSKARISGLRAVAGILLPWGAILYTSGLGREGWPLTLVMLAFSGWLYFYARDRAAYDEFVADLEAYRPEYP